MTEFLTVNVFFFFFKGIMVARDVLAGKVIFLCSQTNFTLSLNLPYSIRLHPFPQIHLFFRGRGLP